MKSIPLFSFVCLLMAVGFSHTLSSAGTDDLQTAMQKYLTCLPLHLVNLEQQEISISNEELCLATIYATTGMKPLWVSQYGPGEKAADIFQILMNAENEGLRADDYDIKHIQNLWQEREPELLAELDTLLTLNLIKYAHDVSRGRIIPYITEPVLFAEAGDKHFKPVQTVREALAARDLPGYLAGLPPFHKYYRNLRQALQHFRNSTEKTEWEPVSDGKTLHPGDSDERIRQVRKVLATSGFYAAPTDNQVHFDEPLVKAIKKFQKSFRLEDDGIIGKNTLAALNMSPEEKINTIILNMARWRWHNHELGRRYIMVNIANYQLEAVEDDRKILEMAVIVGQFQNQTPVFSDTIKYLEFNPFWNIPPSIARNEELPELQKDPHYLVNRHVRLFSGWQEGDEEIDSTTINWNTVTPREMNRYKLRQDPGSWNALGRVKFVFPNKHDIYLHDTPAHDLFKRSKRSFSHGCIRVSAPLLLAEFALKEERTPWPMEKINETIASGGRKIVKISNPLPVHITYQTAEVDKQGNIHFNNDNYARDAKLAEILLSRRSNATESN